MSSKRPRLSAERPAPLAFADVKPILIRLERIADSVVVVGGQAVNFWAELYAPRVPTIEREAPFTSKDIDFCGDVRAVRICAERLAGTSRIATMDDVTPNTGVVTFADDAGVKRTIDFLDAPLGLRAEEVHRMAIPAEILDAAGKPAGPPFRIMHPVQVMESRVHNAMTLPGYDSPAALKQLRLSVICAREFIRDMIDSDRFRVALTLNERVFTFCLKDRDGREVHAKHGVDPFDAVITDDDRLPARFRDTRYPQMQRELTLRRARRRATGLEGPQLKTADRIGADEIERQLRDSLESVRAKRKPKKPRP